MANFQFKGSLPASKSILNRLLIIQSYKPSLVIQSDSHCDDVAYMKKALAQVLSSENHEADCGAAGTTFRFIALRASRIPGQHLIKGTGRLLGRPQDTLLDILEQLGVQAELTPQGLFMRTQGWQAPKAPILVDRSKSSQFASALLLNAWGLDFDLEIEFQGVKDGGGLSEGYLGMSKELLKQAGMKLTSLAHGLQVAKKSLVQTNEMEAELDVSSAFAMAALGALCGHVEIENWPEPSLQPDAVFPHILTQMGAQVDASTPRHLSVSEAKPLQAVDVNLAHCPDLFPVLSVLCALASGKSRLYGAPHLVHKESSRIETSAALVKLLGRQAQVQPDGMIIEGRPIEPDEWDSQDAANFDPSQDHRLAMAGALARQAGCPLRILHPEVVNKSFPEFWQVFQSGGGKPL